MKLFKNSALIILVGMMLLFPAIAQEQEDQYNPNSINPIPKYEHLWKKRVWVEIDLKEKQNKGFFSNNGWKKLFMRVSGNSTPEAPF